MQIIIAVIARARSAQTFGKMEISSTEKVFASAPELAGMRIPLPYNGMRQADGREDGHGRTHNALDAHVARAGRLAAEAALPVTIAPAKQLPPRRRLQPRLAKFAPAGGLLLVLNGDRSRRLTDFGSAPGGEVGGALAEALVVHVEEGEIHNGN